MTAPLALEILVERDTTPISGTIAVAGAAPRTFSGWTGLFACLREMVETEPQPEAICVSDF